MIDSVRKDYVKIETESDDHAKLAKSQEMLKSIKHISSKIPWYIPLLLVLSILIKALVSYFNKNLGVKGNVLKAFWKYGIQIITVSPLMFYEMKRKKNVSSLFAPKILLILMLCQIFKSLTVICDIVASNLTTASNAAVLSGVTSIILHVWKRIKG